MKMCYAVSIALACWALSGCASSSPEVATIDADGVATFGAGRMEIQEGIPVVTVAGSHYEMGLQCGVLLREELRECIEKANSILHVTENLAPRILKPFAEPIFRNMVRRQLYRTLPDHYRDELRGIADGSGIPLADVVIAAAGSGTFEFACTSVVSRSEGRILLGRNLDWAPGFFGEMPVIVDFHPVGENAHVSAGFVPLPGGALTAMNEHGIAVSVNHVGGSQEGRTGGMPMYYLTREVLAHAATLSEAEAILGRYEGRDYWIVSVISADEEKGAQYELAGHDMEVVSAGVGQSIYALNGFATDAMRIRHTTLLYDANTISDMRAYELDSLLLGDVPGTPDELLDILGFDGAPLIGESRWTGQGINHPGTLQRAVLDPQEGCLYVGYAPMYAGWAPVHVFDVGTGRLSLYREADPITSGVQYASGLSWYPDYYVSLYGGQAADMVDIIRQAPDLRPYAIDSLFDIREYDESAVDGEWLARLLEDRRDSSSNLRFLNNAAGDLYYSREEYREAEYWYSRALAEPDCMPEERIRALAGLARVCGALASTDAGASHGAAVYAARCIDTLEAYRGAFEFTDDEENLIAEMEACDAGP